MAVTLGEMSKKEDIQKENQKLLENIRKLKEEEQDTYTSKEKYKNKYNNMKVMMEEKEKTVESLEIKCKNLEDKLEEEKNALEFERGIRIEVDPVVEIEKREAKHKIEIGKIRKMYEADIAGKDTEIKGLKDDSVQKLRERNAMYAKTQEKEAELNSAKVTIRDQD